MFLFETSQLSRARTLLGADLGSQKQQSATKPSDNNLLSALLNSINRQRRYAGFNELGMRQALQGSLLFTLIVLLLAFFEQLRLLPFISLVLFFAEYFRITRYALLRSSEFEKDYTAFLLSLASAVRTGLDPLVALFKAADLFAENSPVHQEILKTKSLVDRGEAEEVAIASFAVAVKHPDVQLFRGAFILARKEGSSLSECLQRLAKVTRQRQSFRRRIKSAVAMQKMSALGIAACTIAIAIIQALTNPKAFVVAWQHEIGFKLLLVGLSLVLIGVAWMLSMSRSKL